MATCQSRGDTMTEALCPICREPLTMHGEADCPRACLEVKDSIISALKANVDGKESLLDLLLTEIEGGSDVDR